MLAIRSICCVCVDEDGSTDLCLVASGTNKVSVYGLPAGILLSTHYLHQQHRVRDAIAGIACIPSNSPIPAPSTHIADARDGGEGWGARVLHFCYWAGRVFATFTLSLPPSPGTNKAGNFLLSDGPTCTLPDRIIHAHYNSPNTKGPPNQVIGAFSLILAHAQICSVSLHPHPSSNGSLNSNVAIGFAQRLIIDGVSRLEGFTSLITCATFIDSCKGRDGADGSSTFGLGTIFDGIVIIKHNKTRQSTSILASLQGHKGTIFDLQWNAERRLLASCSDDRSIRCWWQSPLSHCWRNAPVMEMYGHASRIWAIRWASRGNLLLSVGEDCTLRAWTPPPAATDPDVDHSTNHFGALLHSLGFVGTTLGVVGVRDGTGCFRVVVGGECGALCTLRIANNNDNNGAIESKNAKIPVIDYALVPIYTLPSSPRGRGEQDSQPKALAFNAQQKSFNVLLADGSIVVGRGEGSQTTSIPPPSPLYSFPRKSIARRALVETTESFAIAATLDGLVHIQRLDGAGGGSNADKDDCLFTFMIGKECRKQIVWLSVHESCELHDREGGTGVQRLFVCVQNSDLRTCLLTLTISQQAKEEKKDDQGRHFETRIQEILIPDSNKITSTLFDDDDDGKGGLLWIGCRKGHLVALKCGDDGDLAIKPLLCRQLFTDQISSICKLPSSSSHGNDSENGLLVAQRTGTVHMLTHACIPSNSGLQLHLVIKWSQRVTRGWLEQLLAINAHLILCACFEKNSFILKSLWSDLCLLKLSTGGSHRQWRLAHLPPPPPPSKAAAATTKRGESIAIDDDLCAKDRDRGGCIRFAFIRLGTVWQASYPLAPSRSPTNTLTGHQPFSTEIHRAIAIVGNLLFVGGEDGCLSIGTLQTGDDGGTVAIKLASRNASAHNSVGIKHISLLDCAGSASVDHYHPPMLLVLTVGSQEECHCWRLVHNRHHDEANHPPLLSKIATMAALTDGRQCRIMTSCIYKWWLWRPDGGDRDGNFLVGIIVGGSDGGIRGFNLEGRSLCGAESAGQSVEEQRPWMIAKLNACPLSMQTCTVHTNNAAYHLLFVGDSKGGLSVYAHKEQIAATVDGGAGGKDHSPFTLAAHSPNHHQNAINSLCIIPNTRKQGGCGVWVVSGGDDGHVKMAMYTLDRGGDGALVVVDDHPCAHASTITSIVLGNSKNGNIKSASDDIDNSYIGYRLYSVGVDQRIVEWSLAAMVGEEALRLTRCNGSVFHTQVADVGAAALDATKTAIVVAGMGLEAIPLDN